MKARSSGARTLDMVQKELDKLEELSATHNRQLAELNEASTRSYDRKQELQERVNSFKSKGVELAKLEMQKERFSKDKIELESEINALQEELKKVRLFFVVKSVHRLPLHHHPTPPRPPTPNPLMTNKLPLPTVRVTTDSLTKNAFPESFH